MKVFVAHLIVMEIHKKNSLEQYWSRDSILNMPFFGHYMSRYRFQNILWNLHISNPDETNPLKGEADHDPLFLVRPKVDMMQRNFCTKYRPGKELSLDESMCPIKGQSHFKCYNPKKPNRFHIKLFMVSEPFTGYICGFEVYTGDASGQWQGNVQEVQDASKTSCTVLGLLDSVQLLDMGHHVYFDNYYNSPDLIELLYKRKTHACGTVRKNRKSLPLAVTEAKLKQGETVFCHKSNLLALKWMDKREVYILSGLHKATNVISKKTNYKGQKVTQPQPVFLYNRYMSGVDLTDQFLQYYSFLHKSVKWSKKFFVHCLNMVILNAHILHKKYSDSKITHWQFRIQLVKHMLSNVWQQPWGIVPVTDSPLCLAERHFIEPIPGQEGARTKHPSHSILYVMSAKRHCQMLVWGTVTNPKSSPLTGVQYVSVHCVLIFVLGYITLKRTTQVKYWKLLEWVWSLFNKILNMFKQMLNMSNEATQLKWDNLTAWAYSTCTQVPESTIYHV